MSNEVVWHKAETVGKHTDMEAHMPRLRHYAGLCQRIVEFGVYDCTSTWALLGGIPKWMRSYDIARRKEVDEVEAIISSLQHIDFKFVLGNTLEVEIEETDLLFIDSMHTYQHMQTELQLHACKVRRFILAHDTVTFGEVDQYGKRPGIWPAITEFLAANPQWQLREHFTDCHGLAVLERVSG